MYNACERITSFAMTDIRIDANAAERLIARLLREKLPPADANQLASDISRGLLAAMPAGLRPGLKGWRMIPEFLPGDRERSQFVQDARYQGFDVDWSRASVFWRLVYRYGQPVPDDVVI
jgi:hypothetical protein